MNNSPVEQRIVEGVRRDIELYGIDSVVDVFRAAIDLEEALYGSDLPTGPTKINQCLFALRKSLEGIFGHDLPYDENETTNYDNCSRK